MELELIIDKMRLVAGAAAAQRVRRADHAQHAPRGAHELLEPRAAREQLLAALSHAFVDGQSLRTYRHAPNAGSRKSWAAGDATSRAVRRADIAMRGEMGIPGVLSAPQWGFYDVLFAKTNKDQQGQPTPEPGTSRGWPARDQAESAQPG